MSGPALLGLSTNLANFRKAQHGKVTGIVVACFFIGGAFFAAFYRSVLSPKLPEYFLIVAIFTGFVDILMLLFVRKIEPDQEYEVLDCPDINDSSQSSITPLQSTDNLKQSDKSSTNTRGPSTPWYSMEFHLLLWIFLMTAPVGHVILVTTSTYSDSLGFQEQTTSIITAGAILSAAMVFLGGCLSDFALSTFPRMYIATVIIAAHSIALLIAIFHVDYLPVLIFLVITNSALFFCFDVSVITELHERFGEEHYGKTLGIFFTLQSILTIFIQYVVSWFYDTERRRQESDDTLCHGKCCFIKGFLVLISMSLLGVVLTCIYLYKRRCH